MFSLSGELYSKQDFLLSLLFTAGLYVNFLWKIQSYNLDFWKCKFKQDTIFNHQVGKN